MMRAPVENCPETAKLPLSKLPRPKNPQKSEVSRAFVVSYLNVTWRLSSLKRLARSLGEDLGGPRQSDRLPSSLILTTGFCPVEQQAGIGRCQVVVQNQRGDSAGGTRVDLIKTTPVESHRSTSKGGSAIGIQGNIS